MNFEKDDILVLNDVVWLHQRLIDNLFQISDAYHRKVRSKYKLTVQPCYRHHNILPDTGKGWRWAKIKHNFYYSLNNIPNRKPTFYRESLGDREQLVNSYNEAIENRTTSLLEPHFLHYKREIYKVYLRSYLDCSKIQQQNLCIAAALLESCIQWIEDQNIDLTKNTIFKEYSELLVKYDIRYLPHNYRKFKEKVMEVMGEGTPIVEVITLPRSGNNNALTFIDEEVKSWAIQLRSMGQNYSNDAIIRRVSHLCRLTSKPMPSRRWFGQNIFEKHYTKFITSVARFGSGERGSQLFEGYIPMKNALFAGDCWHVDATRMNLVAHKTEAGEKKHLFIIAVRDVHSGDVLGYNFDYKEDRWSVISAVKMAVIESGYLPYQIVFDRFPGHNTEEVKRLFAQLEQMGVKVTISHNPQSKAKLERWFGTLQSVFMDSSEYYYGEGVKSKRLNAHRSPEYLKEVRKQANKDKFDLYDAWRESQFIVEAYRETAFSYYSRKYKSINQSPKILHAESEKPHVKFLENWQISMLFGLKKKKKMSNLGLITTDIQGATHHFKIEDYNIISKEPEVILSYDLNDLSKVFIFKKRHHFLVYLCEAYSFEEIQTYSPQAEFNRIAIEKARIKEINYQRSLELAKHTPVYDEVAHLMGKFTTKDEAENADTIRLLNEATAEPVHIIKKAVGSDINTSNDSDIDIDELTTKQI